MGRQMAKKTAKKAGDNVIAANRRARHDFFIEDTIEAGLALEGWEVKSLRDGRAQLTESYVQIHRGEAWLMGAHFSPLIQTSSHIKADPTRTRVPLDLHWSRGRAKLNIGLARGKKQHDKRASTKDRDWQRQKARILKNQ